MEWQLPIQKVEISNINIGNPWARGERSFTQKPMAPLSYFGTQFRMPFITFLFPPLPIIEYNAHTGKLVLDMSSTNLACIKLNTLQETIINAIIYNQQAWFRSEYTKDQIRDGFQPIIEGQNLILHCPAAVKNVPVYGIKNGQQFQPDNLKPGVRIRVATKIHGISFLTKSSDSNRRTESGDSNRRTESGDSNRNDEISWSGKCRLQHRIQGIIFQKELNQKELNQKELNQKEHT
jgi:hypothetical protein